MTFPTFPSIFFRASADNPSNVLTTVNQTFLPSAVNVADSTISLPGLVYTANTSFKQILATRVYFSNPNTGNPPNVTKLPDGVTANTPYFLSPNPNGGYDLYPEQRATDWMTLTNCTPDETPMPAQNFAQKQNKIIITSQGTGIHTVYSLPLVKEIVNILGGNSKFLNSSTNLHSRMEMQNIDGYLAFQSRLLVRDMLATANYNIYGAQFNHGPSSENVNFQVNFANKRTIAAHYVIRYDETDTFAIVKAPVLPNQVNLSTGVLTSAGVSTSMITGLRARVLLHPGGTLPNELSLNTDYYARSINGLSFALYNNTIDAMNDTNRILYTSQGTVGFSVICPERPSDIDRYRDIAEIREVRSVGNGGNVLSVRTHNTSSVVLFNMETDFLPNGRFGFSGAGARTLVGVGKVVEGNFDIGKVYVKYPAGATAPTRLDTGRQLENGFYYVTKEPAGAVHTRLHENFSQAFASLNVPTDSATCIKFTSNGIGFCQIQNARSPFGVSVLGDGVGGQTEVNIAPVFTPPVGEKGVLTVLCDYNDPTATGHRIKMFWNGRKVADYQNTGVKRLTPPDTNPSESVVTLFNSPQGHVPFEGLLFDFAFSSSVNEIPEQEILDIHEAYIEKHPNVVFA